MSMMRPALLFCVIQAAVSEIQPCYYYKHLIIILHDYYIIFHDYYFKTIYECIIILGYVL